MTGQTSLLNSSFQIRKCLDTN